MFISVIEAEILGVVEFTPPPHPMVLGVKQDYKLHKNRCITQKIQKS